jgi:hypothetical protein
VKFKLTNEGEFLVSYPQVQCLVSYPLKQNPSLDSTRDFKVREGKVFSVQHFGGLGPHDSTTVQCLFTDAQREGGGNAENQELPVMVLLTVKYRPRHWFPSSQTQRFSSYRDGAGTVQWDAR